MLVRCPFCHRLILRPWLARHEAKHTRRQPDGQMNDHVTVHPQGRHQGSLEGVPKVYHHPKCGGATGMPEKIIRSYLANPFLYGDRSFCTGCGDYVPTEELFWTETGQNMAEYNERLRQDYLDHFGEPPPEQ